MATRVDLHCHSKYSDQTDEWVLRAVSAPESVMEPREIYRLCRRRGMSFVTISDHDRIEGALEIAHLPGAFVSCEVTVSFPEDGCQIHCLTLGISEEQFRDIDRLRGDLYAFRDYTAEQGIVTSVAHPFYRVNDRLTIDHLERLLLLFERFEARNGIHDGGGNALVTELLGRLGPADVERMANRQELAPRGERPWVKHTTGGSDDHGGLYVATTWTQTPDAAGVDALLGHLRAGASVPGGEGGSTHRLAQSIYAIADGYCTLRLGGDSNDSFRTTLRRSRPAGGWPAAPLVRPPRPQGQQRRPLRAGDGTHPAPRRPRAAQRRAPLPLPRPSPPAPRQPRRRPGLTLPPRSGRRRRHAVPLRPPGAAQGRRPAPRGAAPFRGRRRRRTAPQGVGDGHLRRWQRHLPRGRDGRPEGGAARPAPYRPHLPPRSPGRRRARPRPAAALARSSAARLREPAHRPAAGSGGVPHARSARPGRGDHLDAGTARPARLPRRRPSWCAADSRLPCRFRRRRESSPRPWPRGAGMEIHALVPRRHGPGLRAQLGLPRAASSITGSQPKPSSGYRARPTSASSGRSESSPTTGPTWATWRPSETWRRRARARGTAFSPSCGGRSPRPIRSMRLP